MNKNLSSTPAPKKDQIKGSKVNPKGSASSEKSASQIKLDAKTIVALSNKLKEFRESHTNKNITLNDLKAVYRRGLGAYSTSHRPNIPRNAWAMARVNKFLEKAAGKKVKAAYVQDDDLLKMHLGGDMSKHLAPNGKPSNLNHEQWHLVRTPEFKAWFGDWEKLANVSIKDSGIDVITLEYLSKDVSKVVDENGEPKVLFHGSPDIDKINIFKSSKGFDYNFFATDIYEALRYTYDNDRSKVKSFFIYSIKKLDCENLNEKEIIDVKKILKINSVKDAFFKHINEIGFSKISSYKEELGYENLNEDDFLFKIFTQGGDNWVIIEHPIIQDYIKSNGYDSFTTLEGDGGNIAVYNPNQIKLADGTNTTFDANNPDIRYENGGEVDKFIEDGIVELKMYDTTNDHSKIYGFDAEKPLYIQTIIVSKEHRGKGIGSKVMEYIVEYANKNGHDVIFGNITQKAEPNIDVIKSMIVKSGFNTIEGNDDFYKVMNKDVSETGQDIKCRRCGWQWNTSQSEEFDKYVCHNCGFDNRTFYDTDPIGYKDGGELTNACIEEVVNIINSIQEVKDYYIVNRKLVILFQEELMVYSVEMMNYHLGEFTICHDIVDPEININNKEDYKSIFLNLKNDEATIGEFKEGGEVDYKKKTYAKWKSLVNMSSSELERFYNSQEGKDAGLSTKEAKEQGISSGRESARWAMKMKNTKVSDWTPTMWKWANKQISFISRMSGNKGGLYDDKGNKTRKHTSLLIWGNNPKKESSMKYENGGEMDVRMEDTVQRMDNPNFADISYYNNGGEINNQKNTNIMETYKFNEMPLINTISDNDLILIKEEVFSGDIDKPIHKGTRYVSCKVMSKGVMVDSLNLKVIKSVGANSLSAGQNITRPIANLLSNGRKMVGSFKDGGELNPDNKVIKQYFAHDSGNAGGVLVGKRHSEGGIKATNNSTGQPIEMEGGEVVITRGAVSNPKKYNFNGKELTTREILSNLNVDGGGVSFAEGGDVPESINCSCSQMDLGGKLITPKEFIELSEKEFNESNNEAIRN